MPFDLLAWTGEAGRVQVCPVKGDCASFNPILATKIEKKGAPARIAILHGSAKLLVSGF